MNYKSPYANVKASNMICLATNENPHSLPENVISDISQAVQNLNETVINPPAELGRLTDAGGGEQSIKIENSAV